LSLPLILFVGRASPSISPLDFTRGLEDLERLRAVRLPNGVPANKESISGCGR
jgi:hypothetical protein